jgi:hypothetical protein
VEQFENQLAQLQLESSIGRTYVDAKPKPHNQMNYKKKIVVPLYEEAKSRPSMLIDEYHKNPS